MSWTTISTDEVEGPTDGLTLTTSTKVKSVSGGYLVRVDKTLNATVNDNSFMGMPVTAMCYCSGATVPSSISWGSASEVSETTVGTQTIKSRTYSGTPLDNLNNPLPGTIYRLERHIQGESGIPSIISIALAFDPP